MCRHKTKKLQEQVAFSYSYVVINRENEIVMKKTYMGTDAASKFLHELIEIQDKFNDLLNKPKKIKMTYQQSRSWKNETICHICQKSMDPESKVRDHDHLTGKFLGTAHNVCNLLRKESQKIAVFSHNFSGFDSHLLMRPFAQVLKNRRLSVKAIPLNTEKFKCMQLGKYIMLLDSMAFLNSSLQELVSTLQKSNHNFKHVKQMVQDWTGCQDKKKGVKLLLQKGVYPYSFATNIKTLEETTSLPDQVAFYNSLTKQHISNDDYRHAIKVWEVFGIENMLEYTKLYVISDTMQLAEVMMDFRYQMHRHFELDICHYFSLPMMSLDIMLNKTNAQLELLWDHEMYDRFQSNIRGGMSYIGQRHADVSDVNSDESIMYFDANNLYGAAMSMPLPIDGFRWLTEDEVRDFDVMKNVSEKEGPGYVLTVTMEYPQELHKSHNSFPLLPESLNIDEEMLSPYSTECLHQVYRKEKHTATKLTATFNKRVRYTAHGLNIKFAMEQGLKLVEIHDIITFRQVYNNTLRL